MNKISIVILTKDNTSEFFKCIDSIFESKYTNFFIYIADTGSSKENIKKSVEFLKTKNVNKIKLLSYNYYNFAKINNEVVNKHVTEDTDILLFCNNDIELKTDFIDFIGVYNFDEIGTLGAKLKYPNGKIQHAGQFVNIDEYNKLINVGHIGLKKDDNYSGLKKVAGNTFACCATPYDLFKKIGGLSESYIECFEDVQYNIECLLLDKKNIINLDSDIIHYESLTRNKSDSQIDRILRDHRKAFIPFVEKNLDRIKKLNEIWYNI